MTELKTTGNYFGNICFEDENTIIWKLPLISGESLITYLSNNRGMSSQYFLIKDVLARLTLELNFKHDDGKFLNVMDVDNMEFKDTYLSIEISSEDWLPCTLNIDICDGKNGVLSSKIVNVSNVYIDDLLEYYKVIDITDLNINITLKNIDKKYGVLENLPKIAKFSDVKITVDEKNFDCHRAILALRSEYFEKLFHYTGLEVLSKVEDDLKHSTQVLNIDDCKSTTFEYVLRYLYTGICDFSASGKCGTIINDEMLIDLLIAAKRFCIEDMRDDILKILKVTMDDYNVINRYLYTKRIDIEELRILVECYISNMELRLKDSKFISKCLELPEDKIKIFF